ncbi:MAG: DUF790 family protein [Victivallaceae bacterium]|nr:DUF790 family protein [Victivallaceae bacterium]
MLTKDLLKFSRRGKYLRPGFIAASDPALLQLAENLLTVYRDQEEGKYLSRGEIDELLEPVLKSNKDLKLARGLNKLIADRCEFAQAGKFDYPARRREIFLKAAELLPQTSGDHEQFRQLLIQDADCGAFARQDIFADLPENETLVKYRPLFPRELLERYNCAQVQGLLLNAAELEVKVAAGDSAALRRLFKYLKFFRLLAEITRQKSPAGESMLLKISGPASLFENSRKYGLQLAAFFPAVCALEEWQLKADLKLNGKVYRLKLDDSSGLVSHYRNFSAYIPEEIRLFHRLFKQKVDDWQISGDTPFIRDTGPEIIFPDFNFRNRHNAVMYLELFHRWHRGALLRRLEFCAANPELPLLLGVDRALLNSGLAEQLETSVYFRQKGFLFRDFPGVGKVHQLLKENQSSIHTDLQSKSK